MRSTFGYYTLCVASLLGSVSAIDVNLDDSASIAAAAKIVADGALSYYDGSVPGLVPAPYYWWEGGVLWDSLLNYWAVTGDDSYNSIISDALLFQVGPNNNYMPPNQSISEGNDDQAIWALAAMTAVETGFTAPSSPNPTWLELAVNVFNDQAMRWDTSTCGGGLRWQVYTFNAGYDYKNTMSQGYFMQLAARLAAHTGNQTYADWASKVYSWTTNVGLIDPATYAIYDGTSTLANCTTANRLQWSATAGAFLYSSAVMYNFTNGDSTWLARTTGHLDAISLFFTNASIMEEITCEPQNNCNNDQLVFKALLSHWMGSTAAAAPFTADSIFAKLAPSAQAAAAACSGGVNGTACGGKWTMGTYDGMTGLGQELSALEVLLANLAHLTSGGVTVPTSTVTMSATPTPTGGMPILMTSVTSVTPVTSAGSAVASSETTTASVTVEPYTGTAGPSTGTTTASATVAPYTGAAVKVDWAWKGCLAALAMVSYQLV